MVSDQPTRKVQAELHNAGFQPTRTDGSHTWWRSPHGESIALPDGHRTISPGVYRKVQKAIAAAIERSSK